MNQLIVIVFSLLSLSTAAFALNETDLNPWTVEAAFGMATYPNMMNHDGQIAVGRFSLGHALLTKPYWQAGIEVGIQTGNTMRLNVPKESIDALGGVPIEAKMKPMLDVMIGFKTEPLIPFPIIAWLKGGVAYRQLQLDHESVNELQGYSPEIQAGMGYRINEHATFNIGYQIIWGNNPILTLNPQNETGVLHYLPSQQAIVIGITGTL